MKKKGRIFINFLIIGVTIGIVLWIAREEQKENQIKKKNIENSIRNTYQTHITENNIRDKQQTEFIESEKQNKEIEYPKEKIISEYRGYDVMAKLEIPTIKLETYILKNYSVEALNISVTKFWGANANEIGNCCIVGHNFQNEIMFHNLKNLQIDDEFTISDNTIGKIRYKIYDIYTVLPEDISCLDQETNGKREVTLITCTSDSKHRIIVKAQEIEI